MRLAVLIAPGIQSRRPLTHQQSCGGEAPSTSKAAVIVVSKTLYIIYDLAAQLESEQLQVLGRSQVIGGHQQAGRAMFDWYLTREAWAVLRDVPSSMCAQGSDKDDKYGKD